MFGCCMNSSLKKTCAPDATYIYVYICLSVNCVNVTNGQPVNLFFRQKVYMKYNKQRVLPYNHENRSKFEVSLLSLQRIETN